MPGLKVIEPFDRLGFGRRLSRLFRLGFEHEGAAASRGPRDAECLPGQIATVVVPGADVLVQCWDAFAGKASFRYCFSSSVGVNISQLLPCGTC